MITPSPKLHKIPEKVIVISDKNFANVCNKLASAFDSQGIESMFIHAKQNKDDTALLENAFTGDHSKMFVLYYDPGDMSGKTEHLVPNINVPDDISWGAFHGSSIYRVDNIKLEMNALPKSLIVKKNGKIYKKPKRINRKGFNYGKIRRMNRYFDSLTPIVVVGTEDLLGMSEKSAFMGQPQLFEPFKEKKDIDKVGHIATPWGNTDVKKGTEHIRKGFIELGRGDMIGKSKVSHDKCMKFLDGLGMSVATMTSWDYGLGYVGLESLAKSCLCFSKNSVFSKKINSPIIDIRSPADMVEKITYYRNNEDEFNSKRLEQYEWGVNNFTPEAIVDRFIKILDNAIENNWKYIDNRARYLLK